MKKIMLVIDDYNELIALETLLRRIGFDVLSIGRDVLVNDSLLRFHPDIVVATAKGRSVDGLKLAPRLKRLTPAPRVALVHQVGFQLPSDAKYVDGLLESPVQDKSALGVIANLANLDPVGLLEKYDKLALARHTPNRDGIVIVGETRTPDSVTTVMSRPEEEAAQAQWDPITKPGQAATQRTERSNRYDKFLAENDEEPEFQTLAHDKVKAAMKKLAKESEKDKDELDRLDREKREFAKAMFSDDGNDKK